MKLQSRAPRLFLLLSLVATVSVAAAKTLPESHKVQKTDGVVEFEAIGRPSLLKIHGKGEGPTGEMKLVQGKLSADLVFNLNSLETGLSLRDKHMKEKYLKTQDHPNAHFTLVAVENLSEILAAKKNEGRFKGELELNGKKNPLQGNLVYKPNGSDSSVEANFEVKLTDYAIDIPSFAGITVADKIIVKVNLNKLPSTL